LATGQAGSELRKTHVREQDRSFDKKVFDNGGDRSLRLAGPSATGVRRALQWLGQNELPSGGIRVHGKHPRAYPEVTGYLVPTMVACGERALARRCLEWLVSIQESDGSYWDPDRRKAFIFDTGQVVRGLLAGNNLASGTQHAARRACDWLCNQMIDGGRGGFPNEYDGKDHIPESIQLHILPVLRQAADSVGDPRYRETADRCLDFYLRQGGTLDIDATLTHFLAYEIEGLVDLGLVDVVEPVLGRLKSLQLPEGSVRGIGGARWVCVPGLVQLAVCWYKTGRLEAADAAMGWVERRQEASGGFRGSLGPAAWYFPVDEPAWAVKYYLDANIWHTFLHQNAEVSAAGVPYDDDRTEPATASL
jgi:malonyl-CoA O-methyltransferase